MDLSKLIDRMTLEDKIGQMFIGNICGGESLDLARRNLEQFRFGSLQFSGVFERFIRGGHYRPCGVCRNEPLEDVARFLADIKTASREILGVPVILGGDQEGGIGSSIFRRRNVALMPQQMGLGASGSLDDVYRSAQVTAREVKAMGLDMLYGPSLDVNTNPKNPEIGARAFSEDAQIVAAMGEQVIRAYADIGIISNAKHFPGRGHGAANAHHELETIDLDRERLDAVELLPFKRAIDAGVDSVMVGHTLYPTLESNRLPASLSPAIITGLLRNELGFEGVIIPDTLTMFAISKNFDVPTACAMCLEAGSDMIFMKVQDLYAPVIQAIIESVRAGRLTEERINASVERILRLKLARGLFDEIAFRPEAVTSVVGCAEHVEAARKLARNALVVVKNEDDLLPVADPGKASLTVIAPRDMNVVMSNDPVLSHDMLARALRDHFGVVDSIVVDEEPNEVQCFEAVARAKNADAIVFGIYSAGASDALHALLAEITELGRPVVVLITGSPYVTNDLPDAVRAVICGFGITPFMFDAAAAVMAGRETPGGTLPVTVNAQMKRGFAVKLA